jgi:hypothetical protein
MIIMKKVTFILISLFLYSSCTSDQNTIITEKFSLINVSGGFAGINENFAEGEIIWTFNTPNASLTVEKNIQYVFSGLSEGNYSYSVQNINDKQYIFINNIESGSVTNEKNRMIINENEQSTGSGADGFRYQLKK